LPILDCRLKGGQHSAISGRQEKIGSVQVIEALVVLKVMLAKGDWSNWELELTVIMVTSSVGEGVLPAGGPNPGPGVMTFPMLTDFLIGD
jgi:hypothetical protein